jgi:hypothetical protein
MEQRGKSGIYRCRESSEAHARDASASCIWLGMVVVVAPSINSGCRVQCQLHSA